MPFLSGDGKERGFCEHIKYIDFVFKGLFLEQFLFYDFYYTVFKRLRIVFCTSGSERSNEATENLCSGFSLHSWVGKRGFISIPSMVSPSVFTKHPKG